MNRIPGAAVLATAATLIVACAERTPLDPARPGGAPLASARADLGPCADSIAVPAGHRLARRLYADGVQVYRWNGATWAFVAPEAELFADAAMHGRVGTHFAGPTWRTTGGSAVVAAAVSRCTPDAGAIPWLLLAATGHEGGGYFRHVAFIQRVRTTGGQAPAGPGPYAGAEVRVPYTAEYLYFE
ncbi:DUF3455 domain-containing protein [Roseisolibacter sp. H3M3-2]|uniref:DUF3455 domain-containing protein n=1 Tax=Roseisolibacter sp. H3M3-2 TaxID=3031323 RepID=UPI0023D9C59B|nr:DUF3455 domain-containing protein [Roseisolibacter sp. H3M3-2]MDF1503276.1 DUF3455 domain-containing protein [Roseisolibacter sp. H3M3-2]